MLIGGNVKLKDVLKIMNKKITFRIFALLAVAIILPSVAWARIGVGVGAGKVNVSEKLRPGGIYDLPTIPVLNTGDEPSDYKFTLEYHEGQEGREDMGLKPDANWFNFTPQTFRLEPGKAQAVKVTLTIPTKVRPGKYFAYLEAQPTSNDTKNGNASIGIAAASKLWFTVAPSNIFLGIYYRFISLYVRYHPWDTIVLSVLAFAGLIFWLSKKVKLQIVTKK